MNTNMTGSSTMPEDHDITLTGGVLPHDPHLYDQHRSYEDFGEFLLGLGRLIKSGTLPDMEDTEEGENNDLHKAVKKPAPSTITDVFGGTHTVRNVTVMPKRDNAPEGDHYFRVSTKQGSDPAKAHHIHQYPANKYRPAHTYCMTCGGDYCAGMKGLQQAESSGNLHKGIGIHGTAASFMPKIFDQGLRSSKQTGIKNFGKNGDATDLTAKKNGAYMANPTHNAAQAISIAHSAAAKRKSDPMVLLSHVNHHEAHPDEDYTEIFTDQMHAMTPDNPHSATSIRQAARGKVGSFQHQSAGLQRVVDKMPDADLVAAHAHAKAGHAQGKTWAETEKHIDEHHAGMEKYFKGEHSMEYGAAAFPGNRPHTIAGAVSWKHIPREKYAAQDARTKPIHDILQQHGHDPHTAFQHLAALPGVTVHHNPNYNPAAAQAMEKSAVRPKTYYTGTCHADLQDAANGVHKCLPPVAFVFRCAKGTLSKAVRDVSREARDTAGKWTKEPWQMTRAEVVGTNPQTDPLASHWNEEAFLQSDLKPVKIGPVIHRYDYPPKTKVYGDTRGYEFSVADNARQKGQTLLMARHIDANGLPLENGLGQFSPVGEYYHGNTGILQAYRGKGAGVAFTKANMESRRRKHPSIGYSPSGLKTVLQAHKQIITTALSQGKSVPDKVLQDYPEIKKPINKAVRDVSREARIPKGQKGGGEFAPSAQVSLLVVPAKPAPAKPVSTLLTPTQEKQVQAALTSGQAMIEKVGTTYTLKVKPAGKTRSKTIGTFKTIREAKQNVLPALGVDGKETKVTAYQDVGAKIGGARKDIASARARFEEAPTEDGLKNLESEDPAAASRAVVKKIIWPIESVEEMQAKGIDPDVAFAAHVLHDMVSAKPERDEPTFRSYYFVGVNRLKRIIESSPTQALLANRLLEWKKDAEVAIVAAEAQVHIKQGWNYRSDVPGATLYQAEMALLASTLGKRFSTFMQRGDRSVGGVTVSYYNLSHETIYSKKDTGRGYYGLTGYGHNTPEEKWAFVLKHFGKGGSQETTGASTGAKTKTSDEVDIAEQQERLRQWERTVPTTYDRKGGKVATIRRPEDYLKSFGLRGVEFGNYMDDAASRLHVERCAEAFQDLADTIGVSTKDLSLNGRLALAFGARGHGNAAAHYEPHKVVVNLTKLGGAGSLAHEWGHFLDHTINRIESGNTETMKLLSGTVPESRPSRPTPKSLVQDAMRDVMRAVYDGNSHIKYIPAPISRNGYTPHSDTYLKNNNNDAQQALDATFKAFPGTTLAKMKMIADYMAHKTGAKSLNIPVKGSEYHNRMKRCGNYWAKPEEMFARCFEAYVSDNLGSKKRMNNYLVRETKQDLDAPMPRGEQRERINAAMGVLLGAIKADGTLKKAMELSPFDTLSKAVSLWPAE